MNRLVTGVLACIASLSLIVIAPGASVNAAGQAQAYVVKAGDTLLAIALRFDISVTTLQAANNISDPDQLKIGQTLVIPTPGNAAAKRGAAAITHIVQAGDTLGGIGLKYGADMAELMRLNNLNESSLLQIGQTIKVPAAGATVQPQSLAPAVELIPLVAATPIPVQAPVVANGDLDAMRAEVLALYNQVRAANGLPALAYSTVLQQSAQGHADDCSARGQGSHIGSDGTKPSQRITRAGYPGRITGENWAWATSITKAFDMWFYQEIPDGPHLKNILNTRYTEVGFGIAASNGGYYFIANFGAQ